MSEPTFVSVYSGAGGLDLGFIRAGFRAIWANDIDPLAVRTYRDNVGDHIVGGDIRQLNVPEPGSADLVVGGPPCQGFSVAGNMDPTDPRSQHVVYFMAVVNHIQPRAFVMENVKALAANVRWKGIISQLVETAELLGYEATLLLLNAAYYGVPQARERMFLVGIRNARFTPPPPKTHLNPPTIGNVLSSLPPWGSPGNFTICTARVTPARRPVLRRSPYAGLLFNGKGRVLNLEAPALTLPASMGGNRTPIVDQHQLEHGGRCWIEEYHEHLWAGGEPLVEAPDRLRRLTVEEAAALQTFPPGWLFHGTQSAQFRQIGNAVPPDLAYHVALSVANALGTVEQREAA
jgi:DNA (cytosine-5)-methyltransferase 1